MDKHAPFEDEVGLEGPDYVALVIEWDEIADSIEDEITQRTAPIPKPSSRALAVIAGAAGAIALAVWGIRRLRAA